MDKVNNRIIELTVNDPIADEEGICDRAEFLQSYLVFADQRFIGKVRTGHDEHFDVFFREKEMMQWSIAEHEGEGVYAGGYGRGNAVRLILSEEHYRALGGFEDLFGVGVEKSKFFYFFDSRCHHGEWFVVPAFSQPESFDGLVV